MALQLNDCTILFSYLSYNAIRHSRVDRREKKSANPGFQFDVYWCANATHLQFSSIHTWRWKATRSHQVLSIIFNTLASSQLSDAKKNCCIESRCAVAVPVILIHSMNFSLLLFFNLSRFLIGLICFCMRFFDFKETRSVNHHQSCAWADRPHVKLYLN